MGKAGPPMNGKDLHMGDMTCGVLPAAAPLAIGALTLAGMAFAFARDGSGRVAMTFIGEGGTSLGEWHEAINLCAVRKLPAIFCVENNQTALSTPVREQSAARVVRRQGGRLRHSRDHDRRHRSRRDRRRVRVGGRTRARGTRPDAHRARLDADVRSRASRRHALSRQGSAAVAGSIRRCIRSGYADPERYAFWSARDPIAAYAARLAGEGSSTTASSIA